MKLDRNRNPPAQNTEGTPVLTAYSWWDQVPGHLTTKTQLGREGLKPGGPAEAIIHYGSGRREREYELFDRGAAVPKAKATPAQLDALEKARLKARTCRRCGAVQDQLSDLITAVAIRDAWRYSRREIHSGVGCCWACEARAEAAERNGDRDEAIRWARGLTAWQDWCVLDTETAGLWGPPLDIAVLAPDGAALFESLVRPNGPLLTEEELATHIHGLTWAMLESAPTFAEVVMALGTAVAGRTVVVYHREYDQTVLDSACRGLPRPEPSEDAFMKDYLKKDYLKEFMPAAGWECAMLWYADFYGEWSDRRRSYTYQKLPGAGHRAAEDCQAVLELIRRMADAPLSTEAARKGK